MAAPKQHAVTKARAKKLAEAIEVLRALGFAGRQSNDVAGYTLLALLDLEPMQSWTQARSPLRGITPIIEFVDKVYGERYAPNTRETVRDEAVKHFLDAGMILRNPDDPKRPTNSGKTVYQVEPHALELFVAFGSLDWSTRLTAYLKSRAKIRAELQRDRQLARIPVKLSLDKSITISPGGQNPLIKAIIEEFCPRFTLDGKVVYIGDTESKFLHLDTAYLKQLGVAIPTPAIMPDVVVHDAKRNWLLLIEAVTNAGPIDGKRRKELKELFAGCKAGLVFVTTFASREAMRSFLAQISWETEVWIAANPDHLIHFNGERFLGPYPDVLPSPNKAF